jgi:hypothetical protein
MIAAVVTACATYFVDPDEEVATLVGVATVTSVPMLLVGGAFLWAAHGKSENEG